MKIYIQFFTGSFYRVAYNENKIKHKNEYIPFLMQQNAPQRGFLKSQNI